jgi:acetate kinase
MILTINGGSSSIKFALYQTAPMLKKNTSGNLSGIGAGQATLTVNNIKQQFSIKITNYATAITGLLNWLKNEPSMNEVTAIGHRVVHGMKHTEACAITNELLDDLKQAVPYDPDHLPSEIKLIAAFRDAFPNIPQFVCFDTTFHHNMPDVAKLLPIPQRFVQQGIHRYGFHGLSYQYLIQELENLVGKKAAQGRVILCHLGSGASLCAVYEGKSIDTSMGFTPAGGIPMSTRSGDLDPGVAWAMMKNEKLSPAQFNNVINHQSGLLGISGATGDMSQLLKLEKTDHRAAEAISLFCYQAKKWIGAFAAVLGGVDYLVFSGGIGENAPAIRDRICEGLAFLGIELDKERNAENAPFISANEGHTGVWVIPADEELIIAKTVIHLL